MQLHVASVEMIYTEQDNNINEKTTQLFSYERKTIFYCHVWQQLP